MTMSTTKTNQHQNRKSIRDSQVDFECLVGKQKQIKTFLSITFSFKYESIHSFSVVGAARFVRTTSLFPWSLPITAFGVPIVIQLYLSKIGTQVLSTELETCTQGWFLTQVESVANDMTIQDSVVTGTGIVNTINNKTNVTWKRVSQHWLYFPLGNVFKFSLYRFRFSCTNQLQANSILSISFQTRGAQ